MSPTNAEFMAAVVDGRRDFEVGWVCQFAGDPDDDRPVWGGRLYTGKEQQQALLDYDYTSNAYFSVAILRPCPDDGTLSRTQSSFSRLGVLVADDVELESLQGLPSYVLETSASRFQVGVLIDPRDADAADHRLVKALTEELSRRGGNDPSGNTSVRYARLCRGRNGKSTRGNFDCRLSQWRPRHRMSLVDAAAVFGIDLESLRETPGARAVEYRTKPALRSLAGFPDGQRNDGIYRYACSLRARSASLEEARVLVLAQAAACAPPLQEAEALRCLESAWRHQPGKSEAFKNAAHADPETGEIARPQVRTLECFNASSLPPASNTEVFDDELVEGVVGKAAMAVLYGDSNSGKTFLAIDLCAAIAQGAEWLGRHTERGVVLYLATESPASVKMRLRAYQRYHRVQLDWFYVVASPVSLFNAQADMDAVMGTVHRVEHETGQHVSLIVGDTLARLSAGANENSGEDMGVVLQNCDRIRDASGATFLLIHHTGKDAAKGMRGWSGMRAHIDTEVEVTADEATGQRCAEITKQRDLNGKGDRYGFTLEGVTVGVNKWGRQRTSCVVLAAEAPARKGKALKVGPAQQAVLDKLLAIPAGIKRSELVRVLQDDTRTASSIHNAIRRMGEKGIVLEAAGMVALHGEYRKALSHPRMTGIHG